MNAGGKRGVMCLMTEIWRKEYVEVCILVAFVVALVFVRHLEAAIYQVGGSPGDAGPAGR
jgi:hypothetical protein